MLEDLLTQIENGRNALYHFKTEVNADKKLDAHKDNVFNKKFSVIFSAFEDFSVFAERLNESSKESILVQRAIRQRLQHEDQEQISDGGQNLRRRLSEIDRYDCADFKALYVFSKRFLDQYIDLLSTVLPFGMEDIRFKNRYRNPSISVLYKALDEYSGENKIIQGFKNRCLKSFKAVDVYLTQYRNQYIIHQDVDASVGTWFMSDTNGDVRFISKRPSIMLVFLYDIYLIRRNIIAKIVSGVFSRVNLI